MRGARGAFDGVGEGASGWAAGDARDDGVSSRTVHNQTEADVLSINLDRYSRAELFLPTNVACLDSV